MHVGTEEGTTEAASMRAPLWEPFWCAMKRVLQKVHIQKKRRALRIEETLALGERRFLAVVRWNNETLLLGVTQQSITLLQLQAKNEAEMRSRLEEHNA